MPDERETKQASRDLKKGFAWGLFSQGFGPSETKERLVSIFGNDGLHGNGTISAWHREFQELETGHPVTPQRLRPRYFSVEMKERVLCLFKEGKNWREIANILPSEFPNTKIPDSILIYKWRKRWIQAGHLDIASKPTHVPRPGRPSEWHREFIPIQESHNRSSEIASDERLARMSSAELERQADILLYGEPGRNRIGTIMHSQRFSGNYHSHYAENDDELQERNEMVEIWEQQASNVTMPDTEWWDEFDVPVRPSGPRRNFHEGETMKRGYRSNV